MYVLLSDKAPFGGLSCGEDPQTVALNIRRGTFKFAPASAWELISDECKQFVSSLLNTDPKKRPSAEEAQISQWMQRWTIKGDNEEINALSPKTIKALMEFKNVTQMQQRLFEVLSFTLRSEQIVQLRKEFQKLDLFGDGEISVEAFKRALIGTTDASLTELDVEAMFDSLRVQKSASKVSWHEFLAASISSENVDDRNMRLAFNRLDSQRRG